MSFNAITFLENLFRNPAAGAIEVEPAAPAFIPDDLPTEWHLAWDERAAIMEFDGGLPRERAEALALIEILEEMRQRGLG